MRTVTVAGPGITDEGLSILAELDWIEFLDIHDTNVTEIGVRELRKKLPNTIVLSPR
jgi:hypothetical protein